MLFSNWCFVSVCFAGYPSSVSDISRERVRRQAELYWEQVKDALHEGVFHLSHQPNPQALNPDDFSIIPLAKSPVEHCDGKAHKKTLGQQQSVEKGNQQIPSHRLALPPVPSNKTGNAEVGKRKKSPPSAGNMRSFCPTVSSSMAVTMGAALLPLGATLQSQGSCYEIIRIRAEQRTASVRGNGMYASVLPPIARGKNQYNTM